MYGESRPSDIVLMRHGQSVWNAWTDDGHPGVPPRMDGMPDHKTPLTKKGVQQARKTVQYFARAFPEFAVVYHSPYVRTTETTRALVAELPYYVPVYRDLLLVEQQFGWLDAGVAPDAEELERLRAAFNEFRRHVGKFYAKPPNGESWFDVALRTHDFLGKLFRPPWNNKPVLVVSHAVTIATFLYHLAGRDEEETLRIYREHELKNCGIVHFSYRPGKYPRWELCEWNKVVWEA